jgi:hypothetical protein
VITAAQPRAGTSVRPSDKEANHRFRVVCERVARLGLTQVYFGSRVYSITSSARSSSDWGMFNPNALAVLRLMACPCRKPHTGDAEGRIG